jgi:hypothetical protein
VIRILRFGHGAIDSQFWIICAWCRRYIGRTEGAGVSHGICPQCKVRHFPERSNA